MKKHKVLIGINYPGKDGDKRAEPGDVVDDLPSKAEKWLVEQGCVEAVKG